MADICSSQVKGFPLDVLEQPSPAELAGLAKGLGRREVVARAQWPAVCRIF